MRGTVAILPNKQRIVFQEKLSVPEAKRRALDVWRKMKLVSTNPIEEAEARFEEFNNKPAKSLDSIRIDKTTPLIKIGGVGEIHYTSSKEGKSTHYVHFLKKKGTMYGHPRGRFFVILAPSTKVEDWLREEGGEVKNPSFPGGTLVMLFWRRAREKYGDEYVEKHESKFRKQLERELRKSRKRYDEIYESENGATGKPRVTRTADGKTKVVFPDRGNQTLIFDEVLSDREAVTEARKIFHEEKPNSGHLIAKNIDKARERYAALSDAAKSKVKDERAWVMKVAWQIQRGIEKRYGHK